MILSPFINNYSFIPEIALKTLIARTDVRALGGGAGQTSTVGYNDVRPFGRK